MRAAITGASGLLGGNLAIVLREAGWEVVCTRRGSSRVEHLAGFDLEWVEADLSEPDALARAFSGADVVYHCAAAVEIVPHVTETMVRANIEGTRHVIEAVGRGAGRLVHCSTVAAIGLHDQDVPTDESVPWNLARFGLDDGYATTKFQAQELVRASRIDAVVVNPTYMIGPYDAKPSSGTLLVEIARGRGLAYPPGWNDFVDVRDVARGMMAAAERGRRGELYILSGHGMPYRELMTRAARIAGAAPPKLAIPRKAAKIAGWVGDRLGSAEVNSSTSRWAFVTNYRFSSAKAERELGYRKGPVEKAIRDAYAWFRERGMV